MKTPKSPFLFIALLAFFLTAATTNAFSETILCANQKVKPKNGLIDLSAALALSETGKCAKGFKALKGVLNDGSHIYGSGSDGSRVVSSNTTLEIGSHEYKDFTVNSGVTLTVPSGTVIKTTGIFTNNGTINVSTYAKGGTAIDASSVIARGIKPAIAGIAPASSGIPTLGNSSVVVASPFGPTGASFKTIGLVLHPGPAGGGGGAPGDGVTGGFGGIGGDGGGTLVIISKGALSNTGTINAKGDDGTFGGGGGGGGILVFASRVSVTSTGPITVNGGNGGQPNADCGAGGGGGAGVVNIVSPIIQDNGTINFAGGAAISQSAAGLVTSNPRSSGGTGGASFGSGGGGGLVKEDGTANASFSGTAGLVNFVNVKPEGLF